MMMRMMMLRLLHRLGPAVPELLLSNCFCCCVIAGSLL
jgi:hypothetical protein